MKILLQTTKKMNAEEKSIYVNVLWLEYRIKSYCRAKKREWKGFRVQADPGNLRSKAEGHTLPQERGSSTEMRSVTYWRDL